MTGSHLIGLLDRYFNHEQKTTCYSLWQLLMVHQVPKSNQKSLISISRKSSSSQIMVVLSGHQKNAQALEVALLHYCRNAHMAFSAPLRSRVNAGVSHMGASHAAGSLKMSGERRIVDNVKDRWMTWPAYAHARCGLLTASFSSNQKNKVTRTTSKVRVMRLRGACYFQFELAMSRGAGEYRSGIGDSHGDLAIIETQGCLARSLPDLFAACPALLIKHGTLPCYSKLSRRVKQCQGDTGTSLLIVATLGFRSKANLQGGLAGSSDTQYDFSCVAICRGRSGEGPKECL